VVWSKSDRCPWSSQSDQREDEKALRDDEAARPGPRRRIAAGAGPPSIDLANYIATGDRIISDGAVNEEATHECDPDEDPEEVTWRLAHAAAILSPSPKVIPPTRLKRVALKCNFPGDSRRDRLSYGPDSGCAAWGGDAWREREQELVVFSAM
jgi:hypothetical protein